jgi:CheY-like chemotaxis protein/HPt (histidine-containing phosphotransfer) domain-containing protein
MAGMNDAKRRRSAAPSRPARAGPARGPAASSASETRSPAALTRVRRLWLALTCAVIAALLVPALLAARASGAVGLLGAALAPLAALLVLAAAWLAFERLVAPELRALERARAELDTRHAAALRNAGEMSQYLRDVSQEVRATMHAVLGQTQLLSRSPLDAAQHRQMRTIDGAARVLLRIINDLLVLSRSGPRSFDVVPMGGSLHDALRVSVDLLETAAKNRGLTLELRLGSDLPDQVLLDTGRLQQVLLGTCRHAIETCAHGALCIDARPLDMSPGRFVLSLRLEPAGELGRAADAPSETAEPNRRTPALLIELIGAMGGSLEPLPGPGALELRLPVQRIQASEAQRLRPPPEALAPPVLRLPAASAPMLIVDSDETSRLASVELLENLGFDVEVASSAPDAIERVAQTRFALILLDTDLVGLDGYMAAARILTQLGQARPPIIGLCRAPIAAARERAAAAGMDALLAKPIERDALCAALAEWLPEENNPASSGLRLSQAGALAQATERGRAAKRSTSPPEAGSLASREAAAIARSGARERFVRDVPGQYRALVRAAAEARREDVVGIAAALAGQCRSSGAADLAALCRALEDSRALSIEHVRVAVDSLGRALDGVLDALDRPVALPDSPPASATSESTPERP